MSDARLVASSGGNYRIDNARLVGEFGAQYRPFRERVLQIIDGVRRDSGVAPLD